MTCCSPSGYRTIFGAKVVDRDLRRYRRKGLTGSARWIFDRLAGEGVAGRSVLEIGGGIGDLQVELIRAGAAHATNVEIIDTYEEAARGLTAEHGLAEHVERRVGDYAVDPDQTPAADIVIMHRVICCYPDPETLMAAACDHSHDRVAITIPRDVWWNRIGFATMNVWFRCRRITFQTYVHPVAYMLHVAAAHGFQVAQSQRGPVWASLILTRIREEVPLGS